jgi:hypothetical protein
LNPVGPQTLRALILPSIVTLANPLAAQDPRPGIAAPEFVRSPQTFERMAAYELFLEDLDGDTDLDGVISGYGTSLILRNDGRGHFAEARRVQSIHGLAVGDLDADGDPDLIVAPGELDSENRVTGSCPVHLNDGRGEFEPVDIEVCGGGRPQFTLLQLADLDADGDLDAVNSRHDGKAFAWLNDGSGRFERSGVTLPAYPSFCDLNGDGYDDVVSRESELETRCDSISGRCGEDGWTPRGGETGIRVYLNDRAGHFESHTFLPLSRLARGSHTLSWFIDIDNDGDRDVIYTDGPGRAQPVGVLRNDGRGRLTRSGEGLATVENGRIGAGDLNNDGFVDLVITSLNQPAQIWMNDGSGAFFDSGVRLGERFGSLSLAVADLDQDGDRDIFITDYQRPGTSVWFNQLNPDVGSSE